jgi:uncharacterized membrane protein
LLSLESSSDPSLPTAVRLVLVALLILGASVWIGGMAAVTVLSVVSGRTLQPEARTRLFREFGRRYLSVAGTALVMTVACGGVLLIARGWDGLATAIVAVTVALVVALIFGVRQARAMGRLRRSVAQQADDGQADEAAQRAVVAGALRARLLRSLIALLTVALFVLAISTAGG